MARATRGDHRGRMHKLSGMMRLGLAGLAVAAAVIGASFVVPGDLGALLRGYGAMLVPAACWLLGGVAVRALVARRPAEARPRRPIIISARDGSLRP